MVELVVTRARISPRVWLTSIMTSSATGVPSEGVVTLHITLERSSTKFLAARLKRPQRLSANHEHDQIKRPNGKQLPFGIRNTFGIDERYKAFSFLRLSWRVWSLIISQRRKMKRWKQGTQLN